MLTESRGCLLLQATSLALVVAMLVAASASGQEPQPVASTAPRLGLAAVLARAVDSNPLMRAYRLLQEIPLVCSQTDCDHMGDVRNILGCFYREWGYYFSQNLHQDLEKFIHLRA